MFSRQITVILEHLAAKMALRTYVSRTKLFVNMTIARTVVAKRNHPQQWFLLEAFIRHFVSDSQAMLKLEPTNASLAEMTRGNLNWRRPDIYQSVEVRVGLRRHVIIMSLPICSALISSTVMITVPTPEILAKYLRMSTHFSF